MVINHNYTPSRHCSSVQPYTAVEACPLGPEPSLGRHLCDPASLLYGYALSTKIPACLPNGARSIHSHVRFATLGMQANHKCCTCMRSMENRVSARKRHVLAVAKLWLVRGIQVSCKNNSDCGVADPDPHYELPHMVTSPDS